MLSGSEHCPGFLFISLYLGFRVFLWFLVWLWFSQMACLSWFKAFLEIVFFVVLCGGALHVFDEFIPSCLVVGSPYPSFGVVLLYMFFNLLYYGVSFGLIPLSSSAIRLHQCLGSWWCCACFLLPISWFATSAMLGWCPIFGVILPWLIHFCISNVFWSLQWA